MARGVISLSYDVHRMILSPSRDGAAQMIRPQHLERKALSPKSVLETHGHLTPLSPGPVQTTPSCPHLQPPEQVPNPRAISLLTASPALLAVGLFLAGYRRTPAVPPRLCQLGIRCLSLPPLLCHVRTFQALARGERLSCG